MSGFFSKLFGGKKKETSAVHGGTAVQVIDDVMKGLIEKAQLDLNYTCTTDGAGAEGQIEEVTVQFSGQDEALLTEKEGALLDAFQLFIKRVLQHQLPEARVNVSFDCNNFREESSRSLVELAEKLKEKALEQGRSVYLRALPPKDRKIVHQHLATDERVRSRSVGEGLYKKIKIYPVKNGGRDISNEASRHEAGHESGHEASETV
jgi:spoIIIJ-associated protein